ncbi:30S ribosomal protein S3 [archaeon]|jgi:small subunit ribosomal protein S3|nr:30S ribosomal protein S3 [archaeon]NHV06738.1 30S ribosomal protein S3 [Nitrososphaerota archaeon]
MLKKSYVQEAKKKVLVEEFLKEYLKSAGYSSMKMVETPIGTSITLVVGRPGQVIGPGGKNIRELSEILSQRFGLKNPQISVVELKDPFLDPYVVATRIGEAIERGIKYRRAVRLFLRRIQAAGAIGAEIKVQGKLTTERSRFEKYRFGYLPAAGDPKDKFVRVATVSILVPQGLIGIKVKILPPGIKLPDQVEVIEPQSPEGTPEQESLQTSQQETKPETGETNESKS